MTRQAFSYLRDEIQLGVARRCMAGFVQYTYPGYLMGWMHKEICLALDEFLQQVVDGLSPRLMINTPPRHGKTELVSERFPSYVFGRYPDFKIINTSYSPELAELINRHCQMIIDSDKYKELFSDTRLPNRNESYKRTYKQFDIPGHSGGLRSTGVGGAITGMGGQILLIDDPFKNRMEADSPAFRQRVWDWYTSTLYTRREPGAGIIVINTRWHCDDLSGRLIEAMNADEGDAWKIINFEAIATSDEQYRKQGEALHPERYPIDTLISTKRALGTRDFEALYQQKPVPDGGATFNPEWFRYWTTTDLPKKFNKIILSWDMTFKDKKDSDYVVGQVWGKSGANCYLLDQVRARLSFTDTVKAFVMQAKKWPKATAKYVEDKANGPAVIDTLKNKISGIIPVEPDGSKTARAEATTVWFEAGNIWFPDKNIYSWVPDLVKEFQQFPPGGNDDQVDAGVQAIRKLLGKRSIADVYGAKKHE